VRSNEIVDTMRRSLNGIGMELIVGRRMNLKEILQNEMSSAADNIVVVVRGASGMVDKARAAVVDMGRIGSEKVITLVGESFSW